MSSNTDQLKKKKLSIDLTIEELKKWTNYSELLQKNTLMN